MNYPLTQKKLAQYQMELDQYNQQLRRQHRGREQLTLEQYIAQCRGLTPKYETDPRREYQPATPYHRSAHADIPSRSDGVGVAAAAEPKVYTGDLIRGIAVTHKSNLVPVTSQQQAQEIAQMRR